MKKFSFGYIALVISIVLVISAGFVFATEYFGFSDSNPLVILFFYIVLIVSIPEFPVFSIAQSLGFPIVVPSIVFILAVLGLVKSDSRKSFSIIAIALTILAILLYLGSEVLTSSTILPIEVVQFR